MVQCVTYRQHHCYAIKSNQTRIVKTPNGRLVVQNAKKRANGPKCLVTRKYIPGIPHLWPAKYRNLQLHRHCKTVTRAYSGNICGAAVHKRIIRAFLVEEQTIVKKVLKNQKSKENQAVKAHAYKLRRFVGRVVK